MKEAAPMAATSAAGRNARRSRDVENFINDSNWIGIKDLKNIQGLRLHHSWDMTEAPR